MLPTPKLLTTDDAIIQITDIEFDTSDSVYESTVEDEQGLYDDYINSTFWEADDGDDSIDARITAASGNASNLLTIVSS